MMLRGARGRGRPDLAPMTIGGMAPKLPVAAR